MNILDFFCAEKDCEEEFLELKQQYFSELNSTFQSCSECNSNELQKKYLKILFYITKKITKIDK